MKNRLAAVVSTADEYQISETGCIHNKVGHFGAIGHVSLVEISGIVSNIGDVYEYRTWMLSHAGLIGSNKRFSVMTNGISIGFVG